MQLWIMELSSNISILQQSLCYKDNVDSGVWDFGIKLPSPLVNCMTLGILLNFSEPPFPHTKMKLIVATS